MLKKLSTVLFFFIIGVFASAVSAPRVSAYTVLYQSYEVGGEIENTQANDNMVLIGSFMVDTPLLFDALADVHVGLSLKKDGGAVSSNNVQVYIASSTDSVASSSDRLWDSEPQTLPNDDTFHFYDLEVSPSPAPAHWLIPGHSYGVYIYTGNANGDQIFAQSDPLNLVYYGYLSWDGNYGPDFEAQAGLTRIVAVDPETTDPITVVSSSTPVTISSSVYVNEADYVEGMTVKQTIFIKNPKAGSLIAGGVITAVEQTLGTLVFEYPIEHALSSDFSTTTIFSTIGLRTMKTELLKPQFSFWSIFGLNPSTFAVVTRWDSFLVATSTLGDILNANLIGAVDELGVATKTVTSLQSCNPLGSFSLADCVVGLFIPSAEDFVNLFAALQDEFLTRMPIGYVTRTVTILTNNATSTLPSLVLHLPAGSPLSGTSTIFSVDESLTGATNLLTSEYTSDSGSNLWDIITPLFKVLIYLILFFIIINDVTGIHRKNL